jgi:hypothetical protein
MREIEFRKALARDQIEQRRQLGGVVIGHGEADADLDAAIAQPPQAAERCLIGAFLAPEAIMRGADAVERNADVVVADVADAIGVRASTSVPLLDRPT